MSNMKDMDSWTYLGKRRAASGDLGCCKTQLQWLLSLLRAQYWSYQNSHWEATGDNAYELHLLFQRIYAGDEENEGAGDEGLQGEVDSLAEKMVSLFGPYAVDQRVIMKMTAYWIGRWCQVPCLVSRGLYSEKDFHKVVQDTYDMLERMGRLSMGMDDFLMSLDSEHETNEYLLQRVLTHKLASSAWAELSENLSR
jgi:hypothetical protein